MYRPLTLCGFVVLMLTLAVATGWSGDTKKDKDDKKDPPKIKTQLPTYWKKLGLSDAQKKKTLELRSDYAGKIEALKDQIDALKKAENVDLMKILTDVQKAELKKILTDKLGDPKTDKDAKDKKDVKDKGGVEEGVMLHDPAAMRQVARWERLPFVEAVAG